MVSLLNFRNPLPGVLYRSAQPFSSSWPAALEQLRAAGVRAIVDFRGSAERTPGEWEQAEAAGCTVYSLPLDIALPPMETYADLGAFYLLMAESAPKMIAEAARIVAGGEPTLVHCAAGKDRTGLFVALLLDLRGVPAEEIVSDYVLTSVALPDVFTALAASYADVTALNEKASTIPAPLLEAPAEAMVAFLEGIKVKHGGSEQFLLACGVTPAAIAALKAM